MLPICSMETHYTKVKMPSVSAVGMRVHAFNIWVFEKIFWPFENESYQIVGILFELSCIRIFFARVAVTDLINFHKAVKRLYIFHSLMIRFCPSAIFRRVFTVRWSKRVQSVGSFRYICNVWLEILRQMMNMLWVSFKLWLP